MLTLYWSKKCFFNWYLNVVNLVNLILENFYTLNVITYLNKLKIVFLLITLLIINFFSRFQFILRLFIVSVIDVELNPLVHLFHNVAALCYYVVLVG